MLRSDRSLVLPYQRAACSCGTVSYTHLDVYKRQEIANVMAFVASHEASGLNGVVLFVDGGTDALLNSEKVY